MLDEKYTEPNKQQKGVKDAVRTNDPKQSKQLNRFPFDFMLVYVFYK